MKSLEKWSVASLIRIMVKVSQGKRISSSVMAIIVNVDVMLAKRKISLTKLSEEVGVTISNLSILKPVKQRPFVFLLLKPFASRSTVSRVIYWNTGRVNSTN